MRKFYTETELVEGLALSQRFFGEQKITPNEFARYFMDRAIGQLPSVLQSAFETLPTETHLCLSDVVATYEKSGYKCDQAIYWHKNDQKVMNRELTRLRPAIEATCVVLRELLNRTAEQAESGNQIQG